MKSEEWLCIGRLLSAHGLSGWIKAEAFGEGLAYLAALCEEQQVVLRFTKDEQGRLYDGDFCLRAARPSSLPLLLAFTGINSKEEAQHYRLRSLWCKRNLLPDCQDNEYFFADLENCVVKYAGKERGKVIAVLELAGGTMLEIQHSSGNCFVPFIEQFIGDVDIDTGSIELKNTWILE